MGNANVYHDDPEHPKITMHVLDSIWYLNGYGIENAVGALPIVHQ